MTRPPLPRGKTQYPIYRRLGGPHGRSGRVQKISPPPGLDSLTVQPVAGRYTDYDIPARSASSRRLISNAGKSELRILIKSSILL